MNITRNRIKLFISLCLACAAAAFAWESSINTQQAQAASIHCLILSGSIKAERIILLDKKLSKKQRAKYTAELKRNLAEYKKRRCR